MRLVLEYGLKLPTTVVTIVNDLTTLLNFEYHRTKIVGHGRDPGGHIPRGAHPTHVSGHIPRTD